MDENEMTGEDLLTLLDTPAPIWLVMGIDAPSSALLTGNGWFLVYDRGHQPGWRGSFSCRPMAGRYVSSNGVDVVVVADDGTWTSETIR
jgi:hypothetical protein